MSEAQALAGCSRLHSTAAAAVLGSPGSGRLQQVAAVVLGSHPMVRVSPKCGRSAATGLHLRWPLLTAPSARLQLVFFHATWDTLDMTKQIQLGRLWSTKSLPG